MTEQKWEIGKKDLDEIAEMFYRNQCNFELELAALNMSWQGGRLSIQCLKSSMPTRYRLHAVCLKFQKQSRVSTGIL